MVDADTDVVEVLAGPVGDVEVLVVISVLAVDKVVGVDDDTGDNLAGVLLALAAGRLAATGW